jgi:hypothetical protein
MATIDLRQLNKNAGPAVEYCDLGWMNKSRSREAR